MNEPQDPDVRRAYRALLDVLCTYERATGRSCSLVLVVQGEGRYLSMDGKPTDAIGPHQLIEMAEGHS